MLSKGDVEKFIIKELSIICKEPESSYSSKTQLVGEKRSIKSMQLVELLLKMEDYVENLIASSIGIIILQCQKHLAF